MKYIVIFLSFLSLIGIAFGEHDSDQPRVHSIIIPPDMKEKSYDEFMAWCVPYYDDKCIELEQKRIPIFRSPLKQFMSGIPAEEIKCKEDSERTIKINDFEKFYCTSPDTKQVLIKRGWAFDESKACRNPMDCFDSGVSLDGIVYPVPEFPKIDSLRPEDRLQVHHKAGYTIVEITLSSWEEYQTWENDRGSEHDAMPPIPIDENNINPIVFDLLFEMWKFENYEVSKYNKNLFVKNIEKDYGVSNHHGIHDWLKKEYDKEFGESNDGFSSYFEFRDRIYQVRMIAID